MADVYRVIIDDTSPVVYYAPLAEPLTNSDPLTGWVPFFTDSGFPTSASLGDVGNGTSYHVTSLSGAQLSVQWFGTGIQLFGNATGASYDILVDGKASVAFSSSLDENVLAAVDDLKQGNHTISLVARPDTNTTASSIAFDRATATISAERANCTIDTAPVDDRDVAFRGAWSFTSDIAIGGKNQSFHASNSSGDDATFRFTGSAVYVYGFLSERSGPYNVTLDALSASYDGQSPWTEETLLFHATGLDDSQAHNLKIVNAGDSMLAIGTLEVVTVTGGVSTHPHSGLPRGTIAALAVTGALVFLALLGLLLFFLLRRRRRRKSSSPALRGFALGLPAVDLASDDGHGTALAEKGDSTHGRDDPSPVVFAPVFGVAQPPIGPGRQRRRSRTISWAATPHPHDRRGSGSALLANVAGDPGYASTDTNGNRPASAPSIADDLRRIARAEALCLPGAQAATSGGEGGGGRGGGGGGEPGATRRQRDNVLSFIDFASSTPSSIRADNSTSASSSRMDDGAAAAALGEPPGTATTQRFKSSPDQISLTLQGPRRISTTATHARGASAASSGGEEERVSPTESMPVTVSDIQFRPADELSQFDPASRRASGEPSQQQQQHPPHPPLRTTSSPFIVQRMLGIGPGTPPLPTVTVSTPPPAGPPPRPWPMSPRSPGSSPPPPPRGPR